MALNSEVPAVDIKTVRVRDLDLDEAARRFPATGAEADLGTGTSVTLTVQQILGGFITTNAGTAATLTLPTAAALVAALPAAKTGERFIFNVNARGAGTAILATATGITLRGTVAVAAGSSKTISALITNAASGSEAITIYQ